MAVVNQVIHQHEAVIVPMVKTKTLEATREELERSDSPIPVANGGRGVETLADMADPKRPTRAPATAGRRPTMIPECLHVASEMEVLQRLWPVRQQHTPLRVCLPSSEMAALNATLASPVRPPSGQSGWLRAFPLHETVPEALRALEIRRSSLLEQGLRLQSRTDTPVGDDAIVSLLTITAATDEHAVVNRIPDSLQLHRNSFRLLRHIGIGGQEQLLLAWFVNRHGGVGAGVLEVQRTADGGYSVDDPRTGFTFSAGTLLALISGLEDASECRFLDAGTPEPSLQPTVLADLQPSLAKNLHVARGELLAHRSTPRIVPYAPSAEFFGAVEVTAPDLDAGSLLYRNSFLPLGDSVLFVTLHGHAGRLRLREDTGPSPRTLLDCPTGNDRIFAANQGLLEGHPYTLESLAKHLEAGNMVRMEEAMRVQKTTKVAPSATEAATVKPWFVFEPLYAELHYVDPQGRTGTLYFHKQRPPHRTFTLIPPSTPEDKAFAQLNGFELLRRYTTEEITTKLEGEGYESHPPLHDEHHPLHPPRLKRSRAWA